VALTTCPTYLEWLMPLLEVAIGDYETSADLRQVPSAGALYPYMLEIQPASTAGRKIIYDVRRGGFASERVPPNHLDVDSDWTAVLIHVVPTPCTTLMRYGPRGARYVLVDCGAAIANMVWHATRLGYHLEIINGSRAANCPDKHAVGESAIQALLVGKSKPNASEGSRREGDPSRKVDSSIPVTPATGSSIIHHNEYCALVRHRLKTALSRRYISADLARCLTLDPPPVQLNRLRRSASGFLRNPFSDETRASLLEKCRTAVDNITDVCNINIRVRAYRRDENSQGEWYTYDGSEVDVRLTADSISELFYGQRFVDDGCVVLVYGYLPFVKDICEYYASAFLVGSLVQRMYLWAAFYGAATSAVGAMDDQRLASSDGFTPIIAQVFGMPAPSSMKPDAANA